MGKDRCVVIALTRRQTLTTSRRSIADQPNDEGTLKQSIRYMAITTTPETTDSERQEPHERTSGPHA